MFIVVTYLLILKNLVLHHARPGFYDDFDLDQNNLLRIHRSNLYIDGLTWIQVFCYRDFHLKACSGIVSFMLASRFEKLHATRIVWSSKSLRNAKCLFLSKPSEDMLQ